jgi:GNAT superfamily N-acetyltransferase
MPWDFLQHFSCSAELERMDMAEVERATQADIDRCVATVVLAFSGDPAARWMYADAGMFFANFPRFVRAFGGNAFAHGSAHHIAGSAAALWLPPEVGPDEEQLMALIEGSVAPDRRPVVFEVIEAMGAYHPEVPHWYLPLIGTDPARQSQGYGSALLRHALATCDAEMLPAYLEATSPRNVPFYQRHGFEALGTIQVADSPPITPMLRRPR